MRKKKPVLRKEAEGTARNLDIGKLNRMLLGSGPFVDTRTGNAFMIRVDPKTGKEVKVYNG
jgi:hypothetical protein